MRTINKTLALFVISISTFMGSSTVLADTYATTGSLNMRTGPTKAYTRILTLPGGARVESLSVASTGWHKVSYAGKQAISATGTSPWSPGQRQPLRHQILRP